MEINPPDFLNPTKWFGNFGISSDNPMGIVDALQTKFFGFPMYEALLIIGILAILALILILKTLSDRSEW
jgi:hypothetical protein